MYALLHCDRQLSLGSAAAAFTVRVPSPAQCCLQMKTSDMAGAIKADRQNLKMQVGTVGHTAWCQRLGLASC